ncbi:SUKH-4 family immunity protein [Kitasatospora sp. NPDC050463]|uniref:SUKH-4 family immunity protein n=1 Tax=Kitasatospora sp. NPDC050463 TaxID=3155786 RepID=UPI0033D92385
MVTYAQAQELADEWINGGVPRSQQREVRVREFDLGFVCWAVQPVEGAAGDSGGRADGSDGAGGPAGPGGSAGEARLVIARDSGASTLWPALPVNEVVRQYEEVYGRPVAANPAGAAKPAPGPVEATSFLLSPPQWLQEAGAAAIAAEAERLGAPAPAPAPPVVPAPAPAVAPVAPVAPVGPEAVPAPALLTTPPVSERPAGDAPTMLAPPPGHGGPPPMAPHVAPPAPDTPLAPPVAAAPPAPDTPLAPPVAAAPPAAPVRQTGGAEAATVLLPDGLRTNGAGLPGEARPGAEAATVLLPESGYGMAPVPPAAVPEAEQAPTMLAPPDGLPGLMGLPGAPGPGAPVPGAPATPPPGGPGVEHAATMLASPDSLPGLMGLPGAPGPGAPGPGAPAAPAADASHGGLGRGSASVPPPPPPAALRGGSAAPGGAPVSPGRGSASAPPPPPPGELRQSPGAGAPAAAGGRGAGGAPPPPPPAGLRDAGAPPAPPVAGTPGAGVAYERTQLAGAIDPALLGGVPADPGTPPSGGPAVPPPPGPGAPAAGYGYPGAASPVAPAPAPAAAVPPAPAPVPGPPQGAPVPPGVPAVGPGYFAALSYRGPDGSEQKLLHRSEPGTPHPEWKILQDLRRLNVPPEQVLELYTELESCDLPGGYCNRMIAASWPNVRLTHTADYGRDHHSRQAGMAQLLDHLDELHQLASGAQRVRPFRVPLPAPGTVPPLPPIAPQQLGQELGQAFGPNVFLFEQRAVSRQGVPEPVAQTLMWAGLPREFGPFFWAQAQEGRPIPTLAELAAERGLAGGPDFGGYLVLGNDYGRQLCVQYGTAHVVAVDIDGTGEPPRFVNSGVPEFVRALALLGRMWRLRYGLTPDQAGRWTTDFQAQLAAIDPAALQSADTWWAVLLEQFWDGLL